MKDHPDEEVQRAAADPNAGGVELDKDEGESRPITMRMARADEDDVQNVIDFFNFVAEYLDYGTYTTDDDEDSEEIDDERFMDVLRKKWGRRFGPPGVDCSWARVVHGYQVLHDNCCDQSIDYLDWKPEIKAALKAYEAEGGVK